MNMTSNLLTKTSNASAPVLLEYTLAPEVRAFSTTRLGGPEGGGVYGRFNVNEYCGDAPEHVCQCRAQLCATLDLSAEAIVMPHQVHGDKIMAVDEGFTTLDAAQRRALTEGVDAVMTDAAGLCVGVSTADCVPVLLYDAAHHAVAAVHAGWRGTVLRIAEKAVADMGRCYGTRASDLHAVIGPSISPDAFEVGDEVYAAFAEAAYPMARIARRMPAQGGGV